MDWTKLNEMDFFNFAIQWKQIIAEFDKICVQNNAFKLYSTLDFDYVLINSLNIEQNDERDILNELKNALKISNDMIEKIKELNNSALLKVNLSFSIHLVTNYLLLFL